MNNATFVKYIKTKIPKNCKISISSIICKFEGDIDFERPIPDGYITSRHFLYNKCINKESLINFKCNKIPFKINVYFKPKTNEIKLHGSKIDELYESFCKIAQHYRINLNDVKYRICNMRIYMRCSLDDNLENLVSVFNNCDYQVKKIRNTMYYINQLKDKTQRYTIFTINDKIVVAFVVETFNEIFNKLVHFNEHFYIGPKYAGKM
jgi:hypothetical protein